MHQRFSIFLFFLFGSITLCLTTRGELSWGEDHLSKKAKHGAKMVLFTFKFSNPNPEPIIIQKIEASCGCTKAKPPQLPWRIIPDSSHELEIEVHIQGKTGVFTKSLTVITSTGIQELTTSVEIENPVLRTMSVAEREQNLMQSEVDRQSIFKGDCGKCHAEPAKNKYGPSLYEAACGICHDAKHRASMVPDLKPKIKTESADYWRQWITFGKKDGIMPAFASTEKGPLSGSQISTLVHYLSKKETKKKKSVIRSFGVPRSSLRKEENAGN